MKLGSLIGMLVLCAAISVAQVPATTATPVTPGNRDQDPKGGPTTTSSQLKPGGYVRPNERTRFLLYLKKMFGPEAWAKTAVSAGFGTWRNSPSEWGPTWDGFGRRFASGVGKTLINSTVTYGLEEAFALDSHFYRSQKKDLKSRVVSSLLSPVTARDRNGKRVLGFPHIIGTYTANIIAAEAWYPARFKYTSGLETGTVSLGMGALYGLVREFIHK